MKSLALVAIALVASFSAGCRAQQPGATQQVATPPAASPSAAELQQRLHDKLAQPFLRVAPWHLDLAAAQRAAAASGKPILVHCTRSFSPCGTSIRCEREVLSSPEFVAFAAEVELCCFVSAHVDATADAQLAAWRGSGWPHHVVLDATGRVLAVHDSHRDKTVAALRELVAAARAYQQLERDALRDEAALRLSRLRAGIEVGALDLATARALFASCGVLPIADAERIAAAITDLEIAELLRGKDRFDKVVQLQVGGEFCTMHWQGKRPLARNAARDFWGGILLHVEAAPRANLPLQREALAEFDQRFGQERGYRDFLAARREALQRREEAEAKRAETSSAAGAGK